ncbi:uncharacterized protein LOC142340790 [Convolutriloba macropyga]|uniref:uncharacterized protein LOC142340790 n=1 Tax=Convolutriloba macropyga TaxID=536237 RepID=UPI003F528B78
MFGDTLRKKQPHLLSIADYHAVTLLSGYAFQGTNVEFRGSDWLKLFIKFFMTPVMKLYYLIGYDGKKIGDLDMGPVPLVEPHPGLPASFFNNWLAEGWQQNLQSDSPQTSATLEGTTQDIISDGLTQGSQSAFAQARRIRTPRSVRFGN